MSRETMLLLASVAMFAALAGFITGGIVVMRYGDIIASPGTYRSFKAQLNMLPETE